MNKYQLVVFRDGRMIAVSDEEIQYTYPMHVAERLTTGAWDIWQVDNPNDEDRENQKKIIAGLPDLPKIDFSNLSEEECKRIGLLHAETTFKKYFEFEEDENFPNTDGDRNIIEYFEEGLRAAQSMSDKKWTDEDMFNIAIISGGSYKAGGFRTEEQIKKYIQYLSQPKVFDIELEWKCSLCGGENYHKMSCKTDSLRTEEPKITNNSIKITKIL